MNCPDCHAEILYEVNFCPKCGYHLPKKDQSKSTFDVSVLKKIFNRKDKQKPIITDNQPTTPDKQPATSKSIAGINVEQKKVRKWGWGWYIIFGIMFTSLGKIYSNPSGTTSFLPSLGAIISVVIYFYFRNKVLDEMSAINTRSFLSGLISLVISSILVAILAGIIAPSNSVSDKAQEFFKSGESKYDTQDYQGAIEEYNKALEIEPKYVRAYVSLGLTKDKLSDYRGAIQEYNNAIELNPKLAEVYAGRGAVKTQLNDYSGAIQDYSKAVEIKPSYVEAYYSRGVIKNLLKDYQGAIQDYNKAIEMNAKYAEAYLGRSIAKNNISNYQEAIIDNNKAIEINPNYAIAYYNRGVDKYKHGDKSGACLDWNKAGELGLSEAYNLIKENCNK
ncbi:MAG: tetratricopeptide repeat protein [Ignavibacteriaceae bacterium]|nr:tetratricopeptide repeat protein [Ignavibacteriaceae bacterium]